MKRISVKTKITVYFAVIVLIAALLSMGLMYAGTLRVTEENTRNTLKSAAAAAVSCVTLSDPPAVSDSISEITGAQIIVLGKMGKIYYGQAASELISLKMTDGAFQRIEVNGTHFYVYDTLCRKNGQAENAVWIRACASLTTAQIFGSSMLVYWLIMIPVLAAAAALLGILFTKRAFRPVAEINRAAEEITESGDFSQRLPVSAGQRDEFSSMAGNFNRVLDRLGESYESEKQFTSDASHELRTPLSVIMAQAEILTEKLPENEDARRSADSILRQSRQMSRLISELLMISRMENGNLHLTEEEIDVKELLETTCGEMEEQAAKKQIEITAAAEDGIIFRGDQTMLMRVFVNLIGNAVRYGKTGGHVHVTVRKTAPASGGVPFSVRETGAAAAHDRRIDSGADSTCSFTAEVSDDGIGIAEKDLGKIWNRFYQADASRTSGSGLGLFMVKWIIGYYHGKISVRSTPGEGSTFTFSLPLYPDQPAI